MNLKFINMSQLFLHIFVFLAFIAHLRPTLRAFLPLIFFTIASFLNPEGQGTS